MINRGILFELLEQMSIIAVAAYIFSQTEIFNNLLKEKTALSDRLIMISYFSILSVVGTYMGIRVEPKAFANIRPIGVIMAGYMGGPIVGTIVGLIAGINRYSLEGITAFSCSFAAIIEGLIGALGRKCSKNNILNIKIGIIIGLIAETCHMIIILIFSHPFSDALIIVKLVSVPMIIVNTFGVVLFLNIIENTTEHFNKQESLNFEKALNIANNSIYNMRKGLNKNTANKVLKSIYKNIDINTIFLFDENRLLSYFGHKYNYNMLFKKISVYSKSINNFNILLNENGKTITFYCTVISSTDNKAVLGVQLSGSTYIDKYTVRLINKISDLLSSQLDVCRLNELAKKVSSAQYSALKAQIHPHFLFNALNTIASFCRINPVIARDLIISLSNYFRKTLYQTEDFTSIGNDLELIYSYFSIEKARYGNKLNMHINIPKELYNLRIPVFILQPIIENSVKHGISQKPDGGSIYLWAKCIKNDLIFIVKDSGIGMNVDEALKRNSNSIGLKNIQERLKILYGTKYSFNIKSFINEGTSIVIKIPKEVYDYEQLNCSNNRR